MNSFSDNQQDPITEPSQDTRNTPIEHEVHLMEAKSPKFETDIARRMKNIDEFLQTQTQDY